MSPPSVVVASPSHTFSWDLSADRAQLVDHTSGQPAWTGSLLPLFWLQTGTDTPCALTPVLRLAESEIQTDHARLRFELPDLADGELRVTFRATHLRFEHLSLTWRTPTPPRLLSLYFGSAVLTPDERAATPTIDRPFWPNWRVEGFCVASAKTNPMQSFFRSWDFGHADIALGSFGPAMGTPYSAAYPRPTYAACAGGRFGWLCFGAGDVPDAALTFQVRARSGTLEWRYREDLWSPPSTATRIWKNPLWLTWAPSAWEAYRDYFRLFPATAPKPSSHQKSFWGTWGDFRREEFELRSAVDRARDSMEADLICIDDPWEVTKGSCRPHPQRLPTFAADIAHAHERQLGVGIWMPIIWLEDPAAEGLTTDDLLLNRDGIPVRSNWAVDPHETGQRFFCIDPSTPNTRRFLRERTQRVIRDYRPTLLKIDFGYGVPGPDACAPRDPTLRGERLAWSCAKLIADAARELDPTITILGYSLHPLWAAVQDQISLDDLGDAGEHEAAGHGQWSIWAALAADRRAALMGSSGYLWSAESDLLQNSAILGAPGANLPRALPDGSPLPGIPLARRRALFRWHRRTTGWEPLWLDSSPGDLQTEPVPRNWGRLEYFDTRPTLTALALRDPSPAALAAPELRGLNWTGRWILISQDDASIFDSRELAVIPITSGTLQLPYTVPVGEVRAVFADRDEAVPLEWCDGFVHLSHFQDSAERPLLGFLVRT